MFRPFVGAALLCGALLAASPAAAAESCTRADLQSAVDSYLAAQTAGDPARMALAPTVAYAENRQAADIKAGILHNPQKIDFHRSLLDTSSCESFTEVIVTNPAHPYVLGTRLRLAGGKVAKIDSLVTDYGDWLFSAANTLKYSSAEQWTVIPEERRPTRAQILAAANAYLDLFHDKNVAVPWGRPCARLEGGLYTGKGLPDDTCNVGVPSGIDLANRHYIVDEQLGAVATLLEFGPTRLPDSHTFRIEDGRIRYVHTITVCPTFNCGFPLPDQLKPAQP